MLWENTDFTDGAVRSRVFCELCQYDNCVSVRKDAREQREKGYSTVNQGTLYQSGTMKSAVLSTAINSLGGMRCPAQKVLAGRTARGSRLWQIDHDGFASLAFGALNLFLKAVNADAIAHRADHPYRH